ncbi:DUF397 domain-containing protein [Streptomyces sp. NPDC020096]
MTTALDLSNAAWRKASLSESAQGCVEVAFLDGGLVAVRDSKDINKPAHVYPEADWTAFLDSLRGASSAPLTRIVATITPDQVVLSDRQGEAREPHTYTHREWLFFLSGVLKREPQLVAV